MKNLFLIFFSTIMVGLVGLLPLLILYSKRNIANNIFESPIFINRLLSFAIGCLMGDIFFHLFPEVWKEHYLYKTKHAIFGSNHESFFNQPEIWLITGIILFYSLEKIFNVLIKSTLTQTTLIHKTFILLGIIDKKPLQEKNSKSKMIISHKQATGYLNLLANLLDNFTHGMAIATTYNSKTKTGVLISCAIFLHEIPHEFGDFAILLHSGFSTSSAIKAQVFTSLGSLVGACVGLLPFYMTNFLDALSFRILSFTTGAFIHIVLISLLPEIIMRNTQKRENMLQFTNLLIGLALMYIISKLE